MRILEGGGENVVKYLRSRNSLTGGQILISLLEPLSAWSLFLEASTAKMEMYCVELCFSLRYVKWSTVQFGRHFQFFSDIFWITLVWSWWCLLPLVSYRGLCQADVSIMGPSMTHPNMSIITGTRGDRGLRQPIRMHYLDGDPIISQWKFQCLCFWISGPWSKSE